MISQIGTKLLIQRTDDVFIQFLRYFWVGGFAFVIDSGVLYLLTEFLHAHYLLSAAIGFLTGLATNYTLSITWVFNSRALKSRTAEFLVFGLIGLMGLLLNELIIWFCTEIVQMHYMASKMVSGVLVFLFNFVARKFILYK